MEKPQMTQLQPLAPRPSVPQKSSVPRECLIKQHSDAEWEVAYPHIERMYMRERRKLRHVMKKMEEEYAFEASVQMYKKRFAKWGFHKNTKRSGAERTLPKVSKQSTKRTSKKSNFPRQSVFRSKSWGIPMTPEPTGPDTLSLIFFTNIRTWSSAFFESARSPCSTTPEYIEQETSFLLPSRPTPNFMYDPEHASYAFQLVAELLNRGQGVLAGRLARKAFLQIEDMIQIEGPPFIWNLLETMYNIVRLGQGILFDMLLGHLIRLAASQYLNNQHPIRRMLNGLWNLSRVDTNNSTGVVSNQPAGAENLLHMLRAVLQQAWLLNANIVIDNFDARFLFIYYRMNWDTPPTELPGDKMRQLDKLFAKLETKVPTSLVALEEVDARVHPGLKYPRTTTEIRTPPPNYDLLSVSTINALRERSVMELADANSRGRVLSGLLKGRITEDRTVFAKPSTSTSSKNSESNGDRDETRCVTVSTVPRLHARIMAFITKILVDVDLRLGGDIPTAIERMRTLITLREYGQNPTDPVVVHDLWELETLLLLEGHEDEAAEVARKGYVRLEEYVEDIPIDLV
ncbi:Fc.00g108000.m01.CDS01 [Cosmosporella sp. VM-42]